MTQREMERSRSFGTAATEYDRLRSGSPDLAVDWLVDPDTRNAVELGAGTGLFTRTLAQRIPQLYAVEPDDRMRSVFQERFPDITAMAGTAERIPLDDGCVDAVFSKDAWHWFDPETASREIARVLRPGGRLGVLWNLKDHTVPWMDELFAALDNVHPPTREPGLFSLPTGSGFSEPEREVIEWTRPMTPADLVASLGTYSMVLAMPESERARLYDRSREYIDRHPDLTGRPVIDVPFRTVCWRTTLLAA